MQPQPLAFTSAPAPELEKTLIQIGIDGAMHSWRAIIVGTALAFTIAVPIAFHLPLWFQAGVRMIPTPSRKASPYVGAMDPSGGAAPDDVNVPGGIETAADLGRLLSILHSRSLTDDTIRHFGLELTYKATHIEDVRGQFWSGLASANLDRKEGYVELIFEDQDPVRAAAVANYMARQANEVTRKITSAAASQERSFLEVRLGEVRRQVETSAEAHRSFQQKNKLISIEEQTDAVVQTMLHLKEQLITNQIELDRLRTFSSETEPSVVAARHMVQDLTDTLGSLETAGPEGTPDVFTKLSSVPSLRLENERLARDLKEKTAVYEMLLREYEVAKLAEVRDTQSFELLDEAVVPTKKSRPSRAFAILGLTLLGFALSLSAAATRAMWPTLRSYIA